MSSGVQTGNGTSHDKYNIRGIAHPRTNRKDDTFMQRRLVQSFTYLLEWGQGTCTLTKHTRRWTYSALRHFFLWYWLLVSVLVSGITGTLSSMLNVTVSVQILRNYFRGGGQGHDYLDYAGGLGARIGQKFSA